MPVLSQIRIPRWYGGDQKSSRQLHVFVDASERAYAAVASLRTNDAQGVAHTTLVAAKTKTAPLKSLSLPRLELSAAVLGARLLVHLRRELHLPIEAVHLWSDSTVTLAWLRVEPMRWQTYVANRVAEFQKAVPDVHLHHVGTKDNPADCASRGIAAAHLAEHPLWWYGPEWLVNSPTTWDTAPPTLTTTEEERAPAVCHHAPTTESDIDLLLLRYSNLSKLLRVTAWCLRWTRPTRAITEASTPGALQPHELLRAETRWIRLIQHQNFPEDIAAVKRGVSTRTSSRHHAMSPFLDHEGVLRVGGRLKNALLAFDEQHPVILPRDSPFTALVIEQYHRQTMHGGVQLTLASLRQRFWVPRGRQLVKGHIHRCLTCLRWRAAPAAQIMGDLPAHRVIPSRPFLHSGVDYAGPFHITTKVGRGHKGTKGYVAIFVCFSTKAVHIEAVSDYSAHAFLAAFHRFTGRRGMCVTLTSDCGTNFVGADQELRRLFTASSKEAQAIAHRLSEDRVTWKFIPPGASHFGGLWESAVRSVKHHLRRVIGDQILTFEELSIFLTKVEACLNSRSLQALSDDPDDLTALTPGHFLIGGPLTTVPEPTLLDVSPARLSRWQLGRQRLEHFWQRWTDEYLRDLQARHKWTTTQPSMGIEDLVLIRSELTPPSKWPLARVYDVHPGADGHVRVVTVKTATTTFKRPVTTIVFLRRASEL